MFVYFIVIGYPNFQIACMKKIYTLVCLVLILNIYCKAQFVTLDNDEFRTFLVGKYPALFD